MSELRWTSPSDTGSVIVVNGPVDLNGDGVLDADPPPPPLFLGATFLTPLGPNVEQRWTLSWAGGNDRDGNPSPNPLLQYSGLEFPPTSGSLEAPVDYQLDGTLLITGALFNTVTLTAEPADRVLKVVYTSYNYFAYLPGSVTWSYHGAVPANTFWVNRIDCTEV